MYRLIPSKPFLRKSKKLMNGKRKRAQLEKALLLLEADPFSNPLKTHKVQSRKYGLMYSSKVNSDLRLIWNFDEENRLVLLLLDLGGHEGSGKVYL
jgi:mRNA-degrading endonuclease YafQ of YafQ-DinJ toxin-antitoxin module